MCKLNNNVNCTWFSGSKKLAEREYKGNLIRARFLKVRKGREAEEEPLRFHGYIREEGCWKHRALK
jgi:hypothetical protein